jgi:hypothetical protein
LFSLRNYAAVDTERYYNLFDLLNISTNWQLLRTAAMKKLWVLPFLQTKSPQLFVSPSEALFPTAEPHPTLEQLLHYMKEPLVSAIIYRILYKQFENEGQTPSTISPQRVLTVSKANSSSFRQFFGSISHDKRISTVVSVLLYMQDLFSADTLLMEGFPTVTYTEQLSFIAKFTGNKLDNLLLCDKEQLTLVPPCYHNLVVSREVQNVLPEGVSLFAVNTLLNCFDGCRNSLQT